MDIRRTITILLQDGFILVFNLDKLDVVKTAEALLKAGVRNMEVTCRISRPLEKIRQLRKALPEFVLGAASLIDSPGMLAAFNRTHSRDPLPSVDQVAEEGVDFLVSAANFRPQTFEKYSGKIAMIPGCGTTSEIINQFGMGATFCKLFPAKNLGGPEYIQAIDPAIHKLVSIVPTGGTDMNNIKSYISAGVLVLGASFSMMDKATLAEITDMQDYNLLSREMARIHQAIADARREKWPRIDFSTADAESISRTTGRSFNLE